MTRLDKITAPWTAEQVQELNAFQAHGYFHPFTCANRPHPGNREALLVATPDGWICTDCDYRQDWAHAWMADPQTRELSGRIRRIEEETAHITPEYIEQRLKDIQGD